MIGTTAAIIGGSLIAGGATLAASKSNSKSINKATDAQTQSSRDQIDAQERARAENTANLSPWMTRGNAAGDTINALLGIGGTTVVPQGTQSLPAQQALVPAPSWDAFKEDTADLTYEELRARTQALRGGNTALDASKPWLFGGMGAIETYGQQQGVLPQVSQQAGPAQAQNPVQAAANAYEIFKESTGYKARFNEGLRALESNYFGGGVGQSGAAMKAALRYGQDYGSNEFGKYMAYLGNQQGVGFAGASALAGVSQGFADRMSDISQNSANTASQAAIARAQNTGATWGALAGIAGQTAGALSSYAPPVAANSNYAALTPSAAYPMSGGYVRAF